MKKEELEKLIINLPYKELSLLFKNTGFYYRPVIYNDTILWKDEDKEDNRCNIIVENNIVIKIDGWY